MATSAVYTLLDGLRRASDHEGLAYPTGFRSGWVFDVQAMSLENGATLDVVLEESPDGLNNWSTLATVNVAAVGTTQVAKEGTTPTAEVAEGSGYIRVQVANATDAYTVRVQARAPFLDPTDLEAQDLLPQQLREWKDGLVRTVEDAERDVLALLRGDGESDGRLEADLNRPGFLDAIRQAISRQAVHLMVRHKLERAGSPEALKTAQGMTGTASGVLSLLTPFRPTNATPQGVWRGR